MPMPTSFRRNRRRTHERNHASRVPDPQRDIVLERVVNASPGVLWRVLTEPEHAKKWTTPLPWVTVECEIDLRPGGVFRTLMRSPEGESSVNLCCFLDIVEEKRLVWTNALLPGYRPAPTPDVVRIAIGTSSRVPRWMGDRHPTDGGGGRRPRDRKVKHA
jgi:hypothetical protein